MLPCSGWAQARWRSVLLLLIRPRLDGPGSGAFGLVLPVEGPIRAGPWRLDYDAGKGELMECDMTPSHRRGRVVRHPNYATTHARSTRPAEFAHSVEQFAVALNQGGCADLLSDQERFALQQLIQAISMLLGEELPLEHSA